MRRKLEGLGGLLRHICMSPFLSLYEGVGFWIGSLNGGVPWMGSGWEWMGIQLRMLILRSNKIHPIWEYLAEEPLCALSPPFHLHQIHPIRNRPSSPSFKTKLITLCSKQIISTQKQYDFLESLTSEIPLPPSRPNTPPAQSTPHYPRRRRKQSPSQLQEDNASDTVAPKRKRRSPLKEERKEEMEDVKSEMETQNSEMETSQDTYTQKSEVGISQDMKSHNRGWFDIVMGPDSSEDEGPKKRKYKYPSRVYMGLTFCRVKDEDEDDDDDEYIP